MQKRIDSNKPLGNEDGIALVTALMLGLFGMMMVAALLFMVNTGIWTSGGQRRYQTALAAAYGGNELFAREIIQQAVGIGTNLSTLGAAFPGGLLAPGPGATDTAFANKLMTTGSYTPYDPNSPIDNSDAVITFPPVAGGPAITVRATVVNTRLGNTGIEPPLDPPITPPLLTHIPYLYQIQAVGAVNPVAGQAGRFEQARLNSLYVY